MKAPMIILALAAIAFQNPLHAAIDPKIFNAQCQKALESVDAWRAVPGHVGPVVLALGARTQEKDRFHLNPHPGNAATKWIYLDLNEHEPSPETHIQSDFNHPAQMAYLANRLAGKVDAILFDHSVIKFNRWTKKHLACMRRMLSPRGTFFLPLVTWGSLNALADPDAAGSGQSKADYTSALPGIIDRKMAQWAPEPLPPTLLVPERFFTLDKDAQMEVQRRWMMLFHLKRLEKTCREAGFGKVEYVRFTPLFLQSSPEFSDGIEHLACKP